MITEIVRPKGAKMPVPEDYLSFCQPTPRNSQPTFHFPSYISGGERPPNFMVGEY